ncbi:TonB-dependent receptor plug domain-containing protein [Novosphingobium aquae]|uniref:TonB-dependent receptor n=1 Tax=Novosphingobium aquae TaxID=3133435 RepID=A0ABU8SBJ0_9SPHN
MRFGIQKSLMGVSLLALAMPAYAQDAAEDEPKDKEIVVTGTLVRGIAPAGASVITVGNEQVAETGASTTAQLLQTIPQVGSFNDFQAPVAASNFVTTNRPNLRSLPGFTTAGASPTLVLVDGHRVVGAGISVTTPDPDIVPPSLIERVEIVPDGGSAIYGSDAVAGVINFITKKKFDGIEIGGHYGFADKYDSWDASVTAGKTFGDASLFISYNYSQHSELHGRDRDWVFYPLDTIGGAPGSPSTTATSLLCSPGNVSAGFVGSGPATGLGFYGLTPTGARQATLNQCDASDDASIYPREKRHSVMAGMNVQLNDNIEFDVRAFYTDRLITFSEGAFNGQTNFGPSFLASFGFLSSPLFDANKAVGGSCPTQVAPGLIFPLPCNLFETQTVFWKFGPADSINTRNHLKTWGVAPRFTANLGGGWEAKWISSYGESRVRFDGFNLNALGVNAAVSAGLFNPYNPSASNPAALAAIANNELYGDTRQRQLNTKVIVDGELFALPGGGVKVAVGAEYDFEHFSPRNGSIIPGTENTGSNGISVNGTTIIAAYGPLKRVNLSRNVKSAFGELVVPLFGADNAMTGFRELTLSVAGRFDDYSDFGSTFNPKFGITWKPFDALRLRANWGKSFVAPSLADDELAAVNSFNVANLSFLQPTAAQVGTTINGVVIPAVNGRQQIVLLGNRPGITKQTATTWSVGADLDVPFVDGLRLSGTYYNIDYRDIIGQPPFTTSTFYQNFVGTPTITLNPTQAQVDAALASSSQINGASCGANCYVIIDARKQNLSRVKIAGLDLVANYVRLTSFGSVDFSFNGNIDLKRDQAAVSTVPYTDQIFANASRFRFRTSAGAQISGLRAQVSLSHSAGYKLVPAVGVGTTQNSVSAFNVVDLFFKYDFKGDDMLNGLSLSLNVNNVFDADPPVYLKQNGLTPGTNGFANGRTLGRLVQFGINKKF